MPELKRIPQAGVMNTDFNVRILPPGQYREALNVNIGRSETSEVGTVENVLGNLEIYNTGLTDARCIGTYRDNSLERIYFFVTTNNSPNEVNGGEHRIIMYDQIADRTRVLVSDDVLNFHFNNPITGVNLLEDLLFWTDNRNEPRKINVDRAISNPNYYSSDVLMGVAKIAPFLAPTITEAVQDTEISSTFLQDKLPRFSYRWQFEDGEFSVLAPFTPIVFSGSSSLSGDEVVDAGEAFDFVNDVNSISLSVPVEVGAGITNVELIYKDTDSTTVYIIDDKPVASEQSISFNYRSQDPFRAIPGSQITRVSDAVPRTALAQEIAGGRIVYGNYLQNYNLPNLDFIAGITDFGSNPRLANHAVKAIRTYQLGLVLSDRFGRTTPVILSDNGGDTIFVDEGRQQLTLNFTAEAATALQGGDFHSYKVVVKQREQEYYNWYTKNGEFRRAVGNNPDFDPSMPINDTTNDPLLYVTETGLLRRGDSVNKVPVDQTEFVTANAEARPSSRSIYIENQLRSVVIDNDSGLATIVGESEPGDDFIAYEIQPTTSNLDIFYETSTGGLVSDIQAGTTITVEFYNCYVTAIGGKLLEASRIREGFNEPFFDLGVRAHIVNEDFTGEERRANTLIHSSGVFNSRTGLNQLNQFNEAEGGITLSMDPADGSIQKLYAEDTQLTIWQEDKVSRSPIDKDFIYSAEGGAIPVTSNTQYLGTVVGYPGEYGISRDPQSFAVYGQTKYFTDKNRGVVLALNQQGLVELNKSGMNDFFRDALRTSNQIIGSYDEYHNHYNLTILGDGYSSHEDTNRATADLDYYTLSFEQDVNGWVSFKSFQQEAGTTLNNTYYTFNGGNLWQHHVETQPRNNFYGDQTASYIEFVFNDSPSLVKDFKTLGYEGQGQGEDEWQCQYIETDLTTIGQGPELNTGFTNVALEVNFAEGESNAPNTRFRGERNNIVRLTDGVGQAKWIVVVSPISTQYELEPQTIEDELVQPVTLTGGGEGVTISSLRNTSNGLYYFEVTYDVTADSPDLDLTLSGFGGTLVFQTTLLVINVLNGVTNTELKGTVARSFTNEDTREEEIIDIAGTGGYYIEADGDINIDVTAIPADILVTEDSNDNKGYEIFNDPNDPYGVRIELDILTPSTPFGVLNLPITGNAVLAGELSWTVTENDDLTYVLTDGETRRVAPRDVSNKDASITGGVLDLTTQTVTELTIPVANADTASFSYNEIQGTYTGSIVSNIDTADTQVNIDLSGVVVEDVFFTPAQTEFEFNYLGDLVSTTYESNLLGINAWASDTDTTDDIYALPANGAIAVRAAEITEEGGLSRELEVVISPHANYARLTGVEDVLLNITQTGRVYNEEETGTVVNFFYVNNGIDTIVINSITATGDITVSPETITTVAPYDQAEIPYVDAGLGGTIVINFTDGTLTDDYIITIPTPVPPTPTP